MTLTPERLAEIRHLLQEDGNRHDGAIVTYPRSLYTMRDMLAHSDAQQARIAELEAKWLAEREAYLQERNKCEQLEQDAMRYRKLRSWHWSESDFCVVANPKENVKLGVMCPSGQVLDGLLDLYVEEDKN